MDERVPEHTDAPASSSHKSALEPLRKWYRVRKHLMNDDLDNLLKDQLFHLVQWLNTTLFVRGLLSAKVPKSSFAEVHRVLVPLEPTHMEDEDEDQENEKEDERDGEECKVERQQHHADDI